jgi:predicted unusual protein kinase regulating ubiquinone biosynthesis (AarF/ABC1/UbiB family)
VGSLYSHGLYNGDPHPGNYLFTPGRIAILDHGCTREFEPAFVGRIELTFPGEFLLLLRIRLGLMAVLSRMGARANWYRLETGFIESRERG